MKTVVLGVTGGIAACKAAELCSRLVQSDFAVHVIMTEHAQKFVTPLTFETLSRYEVLTDLFGAKEWRPEHVSLADVADLFVCAPCTANFIGKYANGIADDALSSFALTFRGPVLLAPAMNPMMWESPALQRNLAFLEECGVSFVGPVTGRVACGAPGKGRMAEASDIAKKTMQLLSAAK